MTWSSSPASIRELQSAGHRHSERVSARRDQTTAQAAERRQRLAVTLAAVRGQCPPAVPRLADELGALLADDEAFTVVNETSSNMSHFMDYLPLWSPHHYLAGKGGGLGHGMSQAVGVALAEPQRRVVSLVGDGSLLYYPQVFYSAVRTGARVLFVVVNNRAYHVLKLGLAAMGGPWGPRDPDGLDIDVPADILQLAAAFGVAGQRVTVPEGIAPALRAGLDAGVPYVVEVLVRGG